MYNIQEITARMYKICKKTRNAIYNKQTGNKSMFTIVQQKKSKKNM